MSRLDSDRADEGVRSVRVGFVTRQPVRIPTAVSLDDFIHFSTDAPIRTESEDVLGRRELARGLARIVRRAPLANGFAVGVSGPWGSGKSSVLNLMKEALESPAAADRRPPLPPMLNVVQDALYTYQGVAIPETVKVVEFNAWLFAGGSEAASSFFREIAQLARGGGFGPRSRTLAADAGRYASLLAQAAGQAGVPLIACLGQLLTALLHGNPPRGLTSQRNRLANRLRLSNCRIVAIIDDLDRLEDRDICEVFRLIKAVGNLPKVVYVLAFDRQRVGDALECGGFGREYLDKVLQVSQDLPMLRPAAVQRMTRKVLGQAVEQTILPERSPARWDRIMDDIGRLLHTPRDLHRLTNHSLAALALLDGEVSAIDTVALEALRIALPELRGALISDPNVFAPGPFDFVDRSRQDPVQQILPSLRLAPSETLLSLLSELFPKAQGLRNSAGPVSDPTLLDARRVGLPQFLLIYLTSTLDDDDLPADVVMRTLEATADADSLAAILNDLDDQKVGQLAGHIAARADQVPESHIVPTVLEFMRRGDQMTPDSPFALHGYSNQYLVALELLKRLPTPNDPYSAITILVRQASLSSAALILRWFSPESNREVPDGDVLLDEEHARVLTPELARRVLSTQPSVLSSERLIGHLWRLAVDQDEVSGRQLVRQCCEEDVVLLQLLRTANVGSPTGSWDFPAELFGETELRARLERLDPSSFDGYDLRVVESAQAWSNPPASVS